LLGYCGIAVDQIDGCDEKELGYRLDSKYWRQRLATEAASASFLDFTGYIRYETIEGIC
jgi:[ribosomal protein S5]-alanine N-acetyltransferase